MRKMRPPRPRYVTSARSVAVEARHQEGRGVVVEKHVDLLEDVHDHEDGDESDQAEQQIDGELAKQIAVEHPHATARARGPVARTAAPGGRAPGHVTSHA